MKRVKIISIIVVSCLLTSSVWSKVLLRNRSWQEPTSEKSSSSVPGVEVSDEASQHVASVSKEETVDCGDEKFDKFIPLHTLYSVINPNKIEVEYKEIPVAQGSYPVTHGYIDEDYKYRYVDIKFPRFVSDCMKFSDERNKNLLQVEKVGNNLVMKMENNYDFEQDQVYQEYVAKNLADDPPKTTHDKYAYCLVAHGVYDKDFNPIPGEGNISEFPKQRIFLQDINEEENVNLLFASPAKINQLYQDTPYAGEKRTDVNVSCFDVNEMKPEGLLAFESPYKYYADCGECQTAQGIYDALNELENSVGNAEALSEEIRKVLMEDLIKRLEETGEIDAKVARLKELGKEIMQTSDHEAVKPLVEEYEQIVEMLDKYYLQPRVDQLRQHWTAYTHATGERRKELAEKMKELNKDIGQFAKSSFMSDAMINKIAELGLPDQATRVFEFKANSSYYSHVNHGAQVGDFPGNPVKAQKAIDAELVSFRKFTEEKEQEFNVKMGYATYSSGYERQAERARTNRDKVISRYKETEAKYKQEAMSACQQGFFGVRNPVRCKYYYNLLSAEQTQARQDRVLKAVNSYNTAISGYSSRALRFGVLEQEYAKTLSTDTDSYWDAGSGSIFSYSDYGYDYDTGYNYDPILYSFDRSQYSKTQQPLYYQQTGFAGNAAFMMGPSSTMMGDTLNSANPYGYSMPSSFGR